ncbi:hypothetical protein BGZ96_002804 [Linnemannia gamsii]|uniref:FAD-binding domain-containing protein n=1 Tax=Linnemannia gamsii TaxID=64522 RepID=A0ABQ7K8D4_9FUNG|nr:hypothetical protein BGZ96_002804 [Linnemannia gamsii]
MHPITTNSQSLSSAGFKGSDLPPLVTDKPPHALIAGAGLGGLFLGILLEEAGIPYEIFERSAEAKPLGSVMCLSPNILPAFEQLGMMDELLSFPKKSRSRWIRPHFVRSPRAVRYVVQENPLGEDLHVQEDLLFQQNHNGVMLRFSDNTTTHGDTLVGADGTHSAVRQHLYKTLDKEGLLPKSDTNEMTRGYISLLGTTNSLDPVKYPGVLEEDCENVFVVGDKDIPYTWATFTLPGHQICWNFIIQLGFDEIADDQFKSSDWLPQQNQEMMDSIRHFKTIYGTLGDLFDATPIEYVSKVYFEDKLFKTCNHGRTVLIGNAGHKYWTTIRREERFDPVKDQYPQSYMSAKLMYGHM